LINTSKEKKKKENENENEKGGRKKGFDEERRLNMYVRKVRGNDTCELIDVDKRRREVGREIDRMGSKGSFVCARMSHPLRNEVCSDMRV
jgi:hypothetical protein